MCACKTCNALTDMELMTELENMGYDFRKDNKTSEDVKKDTRPLAELSKDDFDWSGAFEAANNEGFVYCEKCEGWLIL